MASNTEDKNYGYKRVVNICMIGPRGVGKTSLLATMHKMLQTSLGGSLKFEPLNDSAFNTLREKFISLGGMVDKPAAMRVVNTDKGSEAIQEYDFGLNRVDNKGKQIKIALVRFFDTPGAMTSSLNEELKKKIADSQIIINAIDAGVMMKIEGPDAEKYNGYDAVKRLLDTCVFTEDAINKLVIFTLIKAETWIMDRGNEKDGKSDWNFLLRKLNEHLSEMLALFPPEAPRLAVICPVETLGCVEFSMVTKREKYSEIHYKKVFGKKFAPKHVHIPLSYAIRFILAEWNNGRGILKSMWDGIFNRTHVKEVLKAFERMDAGERRKLDGALIAPMEYGNKKLLEIKK